MTDTTTQDHADWAKVVSYSPVIGKNGKPVDGCKVVRLGDSWHFMERSHGMWFALMPAEASEEAALARGREYWKTRHNSTRKENAK